MRSIRTITSAAAAAILVSTGLASAGTLYTNDFQNAAPGAEWANGHYSSAPAFSQFMGRYGGIDSTTLTINTAHLLEGNGNGSGGGGGGGGGGGDGSSVNYLLTFDFYAIDSWDGSDANLGPDMFEVKINGAILFNEAFANHNLAQLQTFRAPDVGPALLGFGHDMDSIYRTIAVPFTVDPTASTIQIKFRGSLTQDISDESWGIDNVNVTYTNTPSPGSFALFAMGGLLAARRKR